MNNTTTPVRKPAVLRDEIIALAIEVTSAWKIDRPYEIPMHYLHKRCLEWLELMTEPETN